MTVSSFSIGSRPSFSCLRSICFNSLRVSTPAVDKLVVLPQKEVDKESNTVVDDNCLVSKTQGGDSKAFDNLIRKYHSRLYGLVYHMTSNHEDTNDLLQDIFSKAYRSIQHFHGKSSFYTWIYRIAVNMTLNFIKKQKRQYYTSIDDDDNPIENDPEFIEATKSKAAKDPAALMNNQELQKKLTKAMLQLSAQHRAVVTLFDIQGIPQVEIAKILKTTEGTVRSRLFYAHRQLQNYLKEFIVK
ncbi:MAG: RNA polymerase sigma factor [Chthoniobacterales bacterium]